MALQDRQQGHRAAQGLAATAALLCALAATSAQADEITFDFENGPLDVWDVVNTADLWTIDLDGPTLAITKPEDDLTVEPNGTILGGIRSQFTLEGDFTVTVDYTLTDFPTDPDRRSTLNQALLELRDPGTAFHAIKRFNRGSVGERINGQDPIGTIGEIPSPASILNQGRYRIARTGGTFAYSYAVLGSESFTLLGERVGTTLPMSVALLGFQGRSSSTSPNIRANTSFDIVYDNLIIVADNIVGMSPPFIRGDCNGDTFINLGDVVYDLNYLFEGETVDCLETLDVNNDGQLDISDAVALLIFLFDAGPPPAEPSPNCGEDPETILYECGSYVCP